MNIDRVHDVQGNSCAPKRSDHAIHQRFSANDLFKVESVGAQNRAWSKRRPNETPKINFILCL